MEERIETVEEKKTWLAKQYINQLADIEEDEEEKIAKQDFISTLKNEETVTWDEFLAQMIKWKTLEKQGKL